MVRVMTEVQAFKYGELGTCAAPQETPEQLSELAARDRRAQAQARETDWHKRRGAAQAPVRAAQAAARRAHQRMQQEQQEATRAAPAMPATAPRACAPISRSLLVECLSTNQNACSLLHFVTQSQKLTSLSPRDKR